MTDKFQLGTSFECQCGRTHDVPVRLFCYQANIIENLIPLLSAAFTGRAAEKLVVVADERTSKIYGRRVANELNCRSIIIPDDTGTGPACDDQTCNWLTQQISKESPDAVLAVGSGTINDLCKWAAFELNLPYAVFATAASMNGYAAANVAAKIRGVKVIQRAQAPLAVFAEQSVIEQAPCEMTASGFADTLAKSFSKIDWTMNNQLFGEYYCPFCADILNDIENSYLTSPEKLHTADSQTIKSLFEALFLSGIAMTIVGTSAPASGGEHLLSHVLDMTADINNQGHKLHGLQVGLGTIFSAALYQKILAVNKPLNRKLPGDIDTAYWQNPVLIDSVKQQYASKQEDIKTVSQKISESQFWNQLKETVHPIAKSPDAVKDLLSRAGAAHSYESLDITRNRLKQALLHMHEIRKRFTVVDLAWLTGVLPDETDQIINEYLTG
jgi:glycerol-1-phosphate dehydrogenase [NAD(P)+]